MIQSIVGEEVERRFDDSQSVAFMEKILDEEISNAETIGVMLDRIEDLEQANEEYERRFKELERAVYGTQNLTD